eukprot:TRINITY_DN8694_c0_g3_i1.p1 TRINITY_DN8694_c0_g3~~TRINITY_DN8694_c0_g3_i1.p1  ORF type:complete len:276 (-),score=72.30 TRINITY_DN8694_c0_g3_i1:215-928(-)
MLDVFSHHLVLFSNILGHKDTKLESMNMVVKGIMTELEQTNILSMEEIAFGLSQAALILSNAHNTLDAFAHISEIWTRYEKISELKKIASMKNHKNNKDNIKESKKSKKRRQKLKRLRQKLSFFLSYVYTFADNEKVLMRDELVKEIDTQVGMVNEVMKMKKMAAELEKDFKTANLGDDEDVDVNTNNIIKTGNNDVKIRHNDNDDDGNDIRNLLTSNTNDKKTQKEKVKKPLIEEL